MRDGEAWIVVASNAGRDWHPAWYLNLQRKSEVAVQVKRAKIAALAEDVAAQDAERYWTQFMSLFSGYASYRTKTSRTIPLVRLRPVSSPTTR